MGGHAILVCRSNIGKHKYGSPGSPKLHIAVATAEGLSLLGLLTVLFPSPCQDLTMDTDLTAANGKKVKALEIFAYALQYFKEQALKVGHVAALVAGRGGAPAS